MPSLFGVIVSYIVVVGVVVMDVVVGGVLVLGVGAYPESFRSIYLFTLEL